MRLTGEGWLAYAKNALASSAGLDSDYLREALANVEITLSDVTLVCTRAETTFCDGALTFCWFSGALSEQESRLARSFQGRGNSP